MRSDSEQGTARLSVLTERDTYPRNALIRVTVRVQNIGEGTVVLQEFRSWNPQVGVMDGDRMVSSSADPLRCPTGPSGASPKHPIVLPPETAIERRLYVVLFTERLRPFVQVQQPDGSPIRAGEDLVLDLYDADAPQVTLDRGPPLALEVEPGHEVEGPLFSHQRWDSKRASWWARQWERTEGRRVVQDHAETCDDPDRWDVAAGWLNHPVAIVRYARDGHWSRSI